MHDYEYRAEVLDIAADGLTHFRIDLGFRVYSDQSLPLVDPPAIRPGDRVHLLIRHEDDGRVIARVRDPSLLGFPRLWQYPGTLVRVVDGDTLDARVTIYPGLAIEERFRRSQARRRANRSSTTTSCEANSRPAPPAPASPPTSS